LPTSTIEVTEHRHAGRNQSVTAAQRRAVAGWKVWWCGTPGISAQARLVASVLIVNYLGLYLLMACVLPPGYVMLVLEERELVNRFGKAYEDYRRDVPRLLPYWRKRPEKPPDKSTAV
jgi:hypothetical protein